MIGILSLGLLASSVGVLVAGRELSIEKAQGKSVVIKSTQDGSSTLWYGVSVDGDMPTFEVSGGNIAEEDKESKRESVQLAWKAVLESGSRAFAFGDSKAYWSDIAVIGNGDSDEIRMEAKMVRPETDIAGNYFTVLLRAIVKKDGTESFHIRPFIQNFPYVLSGRARTSRSHLTIDQMVTTSRSGSKSKEASESGAAETLITMGDFTVIASSAIEDGEPGKVAFATIDAADGADRPSSFDSAAVLLRSQVGFASTRPKNATFVEELTFHKGSITTLPKEEDKDRKDGKDAESDAVKGLSSENSGAPSVAMTGSLGVLSAMLALSMAVLL